MSNPSTAPVVIVGAGPTGMTAALDLAHYGVSSILLDEGHALSEGSRAIAFHQSTLAVWEKLGAVEPMLHRGIAWSVRHTYRGLKELYVQDFGVPPAGSLPRYINIPQHDVEQYLLDRIEVTPLIDLRWDQQVVDFTQNDEGATLKVRTPDGEEIVRAKYVLACDGARSAMRKLLRLDFPGFTFNDYFLIADIQAELGFGNEPRFFFDHPTNPDQTVLIHPQPDGIWRIDWQLGLDKDADLEMTSERIDQRIRSLIGDIPYKIVWLSSYRFHQRLLEKLSHGRVFFAGDSAHLVAPFGARGMNSAVQDVENLTWKLAFVLRGLASPELLDTYHTERWAAQAENQRITINTMRFMAPNTSWLRLRRNLILWLSGFYSPARRWVDSGKMIVPYVYTDSPLQVSDDPRDYWPAANTPALGGKLPDAPLNLAHDGKPEASFARKLWGSDFVALYFTKDVAKALEFCSQLIPPDRAFPLTFLPVFPASQAPDDLDCILDPEEKFLKLVNAEPFTLFLVRPDGHLALRRREGQPRDILDYPLIQANFR